MENIIEAKPTKLWNRAYIMLIIALICAMIPMCYVMPLLPIYIKGTLHSTDTVAGLSVALFNLVSVVLTPFVSYLVDHKRKKYIMIVGFILCTITTGLYYFANSVGFLLLVRVAFGIAFALALTPVGPLITDCQAPENRGRASGLYGLFMAFAAAVGPVLGLTFMNAFNIKIAFAILPAFGIIGLICSLLIPKKQELAYAIERTDHHFTLKGSISVPAIPLSIVLFILYFGYVTVPSFFAKYVAGFNLPLANVNIYYFLIFMVTMMITKISFEAFEKKKPGITGKYAIPGVVLICIGFAFCGFGTSTWAFLASAFIYGIGFGIFQPLLFSSIIGGAAPKERGAASATLLYGQYLGMMLGGYAWGFISDVAGTAMIYKGCIITSALSGILYLVLRNKGAKKD